MNHFYTIDFTNAPEIKSILGFESDTLVKGVDNLRRYYLCSSCSQVVVTDGTVLHVLSMPTGYYTFSEFIEAVGNEMVIVLSLISMTINDNHVLFNVQANGWFFDRTSIDTIIDGFGRTPWFKLFPSTRNLCIDRPVETVFDSNGPSLPDVTNNQGFGGHAYLDPSHVVYDWQLRTSYYQFVIKPLVTYTMTNSNCSLLDSGTFYITKDTTTSLTMNSLTTSCFNELSARYAEIRDIPPSHQEAIAWTVKNNGDTMSWTAKDYAPELELSITSGNTTELVINVPRSVPGIPRIVYITAGYS